MLLALALTAAMAFTLMPSAAGAAPAYTTPFGVSVTYQNVGSGPAKISFDFYTENSGTAITVPAADLAKNASTSLSIGSVSAVGSTFKGSAVLSSDQQVIATIVQFDKSGAVKNRPLSNGFAATDSSAKQLVATVLKNSGGYSTYFSVQNTEAAAINVTVSFFAAGATSATTTATANNLPANAAKYFDVKDIAALPNGFSGSAIVTAKLASNNSTEAKTVVTVDELEVAGGGSKSFEGASTSGANVYMPSAACKAPSGSNTVNSAYAIQNADQVNAVTFKVVYKVAGKADVSTAEFNVPAGGKKSILGCDSLPAGSSGSAIIQRTGGTGTLVAVGKINGTNGSVTSAFLGTVEGHGSARIALPYIRYSPQAQFTAATRQRANIAIQNIGSATATNVVVTYIDKDGNTKGTQAFATLAPGAKVSSNAALANALDTCGRFGEYDAPGTAACSGGTFGGGAIVTADGSAQLAVIVRIQTGPVAGEDYNGINLQ
jgi:hypothetical protein